MAGRLKARTLREEKSFSDDKKRLSKSAKRLDEILDGIIWVLARNAESFSIIPGTVLGLAKTDKFPGHDAYYVWFTFDEDTVYLQRIEKAPTEE